MTYQLAKQLKDAGFPGVRLKTKIANLPTKFADKIQAPTLSELIEACGEFFGVLAHQPKHSNCICDSELEHWSANILSYVDVKQTCGNTPEEVVAKLWIELNKTK